MIGPLPGARRHPLDVREIAADHQAHQLVLVGVPQGHGPHMPAVAQDGDVVADGEHLPHPVGDVEHCHPGLLQVGDDAKEDEGLRFGQARGRLVQDQETRIVNQGLGDLDHLLLGDREAADDRVGIEADAEPVEHGHRLAAHRAAVDEGARDARLHPEQDVLGDRHVRGEVELLEDDGDALVVGVARPAQLQGLALEDELAAVRVRPLGAGDDLHQGRLAGTVLAHDGVDRAGLDLERDVLQRLHARVALRDGLDAQKHRHGVLPFLPDLSRRRPGLGQARPPPWLTASCSLRHS